MKVLPLFSLALLLLVPGCASPEEDDRPNVIIIMADDMGYSDISPYGGEINTPNLQRLSDNGTRFTQFYNNARCCPTRAALLTGLYPHQAGVGHMTDDYGFDGYRGFLGDQTATIAEVLGDAGYSTYMSGKWHVTKFMGHWNGVDSLKSKDTWPMQRGFDKFYGTILGAGSFYDPITLTHGNTPIEEVPEDFFYTDAISDTASTFIREHVSNDRDNPFFMYVSYTAPHWPLHAKEKDIELYEGRYNNGWDAVRDERHARMKTIGLLDDTWELTPRDPRVPAWEELSEKDQTWYSKAMEVYAAQVDNMDQGIGNILEALESTGELDNTLILFLADNGGCAEILSANWRGMFIPTETAAGDPITVGNEFRDQMPGPEETYMSYGIGWANASNTPFRLYKHWVHEGGISTPLIVHWPKKFKGTGEFTHEPGHVVDLMATAVDVAGAEYPADKTPMAGKSLLPALAKQAIDRDAIFWEHEGNRAVRQGKWKLVAQHDQPWELYDIEADRSEMNNLAEIHPDRLADMIAAYDTWAAASLVRPWPARQ
ncbi:MAG: arylsulfatase [Rhodothermales bacterium]